MVNSSLRRVGVVVKPHQPEALRTVCYLIEWLDAHGIQLVGTPDLNPSRIEGETGCTTAGCVAGFGGGTIGRGF